LEVPEENEVNQLLAEAEKLKDKTVYVALTFVRKYGLRIGAFENAGDPGFQINHRNKGQSI
jgi:hypothetical protein